MWIAGWLWSQCKGNWPHLNLILGTPSNFAFLGDISVLLVLWQCCWGLSGVQSSKSRLLMCLIGKTRRIQLSNWTELKWTELNLEYVMWKARLVKYKQESRLPGEISITSNTQMTPHMDITRWSTLKSDWLYSLQPKIKKLYTVSKNKTGNWLWLRSWTPYCQIQT